MSIAKLCQGGQNWWWCFMSTLSESSGFSQLDDVSFLALLLFLRWCWCSSNALIFGLCIDISAHTLNLNHLSRNMPTYSLPHNELTMIAQVFKNAQQMGKIALGISKFIHSLHFSEIKARTYYFPRGRVSFPSLEVRELVQYCDF